MSWTTIGSRSKPFADFAAAGLIGCMSMFSGLAQTPTSTAPSEFEVASIKQLDQSIQPGQYDLSFLGTSGKPVKIAGDRVTLTGTLRVLISAAYSVKDYQLTGLPSWTDTPIYAIDARTPGESTPTQEAVRPMLQALLADRFQLKLHRENRELPVYRVIQAKKTNALKPSGPNETYRWVVEAAPGGSVRSKYTGISVVDFIQLVAVSTDRPLIDQTGLTGALDYEISWSTDGIKTPADQNRAIVDAVKEQLGLKLEPAKEQTEMLVIERLEKLSEN
jgi:uncharacterized protein (TIGR03435 family)